MIKTATQLKAKVRNLSGGDSQKAQTLIRNFIMERFLERIALSPYLWSFFLDYLPYNVFSRCFLIENEELQNVSVALHVGIRLFD